MARCENRKPEWAYDPTIEDIYHITLKGGVTLEINDTAGIDSYPTLRDKAIWTGNCFMLVFDVRNRGSFDYLKPIATNIRRQHGDEVPILFVGNRASKNGDKRIAKSEGETLADLFQGSYMEVRDDQKHVGAVFSAALPRTKRAGLRCRPLPKCICLGSRCSRFCG